MQRCVVWCLVFAACGSVDSVPPDALVVDVPPLDMAVATQCEPARAWGAPRLLANINSPQYDASPTLTADELTIYFESDRPEVDASGSSREIWIAQRPDRDATFGAPALVPVVNITPGYDADPMISSDNLQLVTVRSEPGGARSVGLFLSTRTSPVASFSAPVVIANVSSDAWDASGFVSTTSGELIFRSDRGGQADLYRSTGTYAQGFAAATPIIELNSSATEIAPVLSADGLIIYFASSRTDGGAAGSNDIWMAMRASVGTAFSAPMIVPGLNSPQNETPGWLSPDGCRLYFDSDRGGHSELYVAERSPL